MKTIKAPPAPKVANVRCRTEEQCKQIADTLREAYKTGRRFKRVNFKKPPKE